MRTIYRASRFEVMLNRRMPNGTYSGVRGERNMAFVYNEEMQCFSKELSDILFSCEVPDSILEATANRLAKI